MWGPLFDALWFIFPAYVANSAAVDVAGVHFLKKYSAPIDMGKSFRGRRVLGDGKTWRGFFAGVLCGTAAGFIQSSVEPLINYGLPHMSVGLALLLSFGAMFGDMGASFIKRQGGFARGASFPLMDQLDYIVGAFVFALPVASFSAGRFFVVALITLPFHFIANLVAYRVRLKEVWW